MQSQILSGGATVFGSNKDVAAASLNSSGPSAELYLRDLGCVSAVLPG